MRRRPDAAAALRFAGARSARFFIGVPDEPWVTAPEGCCSGGRKMAKYQCDNCSYVYDEAQGCPKEGFPPGTAWTTVPDDWPCPDCAVREKIDFERVESE
ncbi:MAG: rubredoxin [Pseudomonadota bacterium]|nr:rubredoxin [Pseudomonadota bacterium]